MLDRRGMRGTIVRSDSLIYSNWGPRLTGFDFQVSLTRHHIYSIVFVISNTKSQVSQWLERLLFPDAFQCHEFDPSQRWFSLSFSKLSNFSYFLYFPLFLIFLFYFNFFSHFYSALKKLPKNIFLFAFIF